MTGRANRRIVHSSDLHLADRYQLVGPGEHLTPCVCPLLAVAGVVAKVSADLLILAGDTFDNPRPPNETVTKVFDILSGLSVPTVILSGNHDLVSRDSVFLQRELAEGSCHVSLIDRDQVVRATRDIEVFGRAADAHTPEFRPMRGAPPRSNGGWYIVAGHGHYVGSEADKKGAVVRSSPISDKDLASVDADYVALGHWHDCVQVGLSPPAWYSGMPIRGGKAATVLMVDLTENGVHVTREPSPPPADGCAILQ